MKKRVAQIICVTAVLAGLAGSFLSYTESANAIPAFARKYSMSCTTCHAPVPRLKAYGDEFAGNGFVLQDQDAPRFYDKTGDENLSLIRDFPLAVRMDGYIKYESVTDRDIDLTAPYILKLLSGGAISDNLAYYFYFYMSEHGEIVGVEDAYVMFNNLFNSELDLYLGQFQVSDPLFKRELRLTYEDYQVYKTTVGGSKINLAYDRGIMLTYGFPTGTDIIIEILNGNGLTEADDFKVYDEDKYKSFAGRITQDINDYIRIGGFGYYGKEDTELTGNANEVWMAGPDITFAYRDVMELNVQYMERRDSDPWFDGSADPDVESRGAMAELIVMPDGDRSRLYGVGVFNWIESDFENRGGTTYGYPAYKSFTGHVGYLVKTNFRLLGEVTYFPEEEESRALVGFVSGF